ncbi:MAG: leucine-rich repeat domain-containing protein [Prevotella sp.]|nr:leucine-rich repeat domain-containing protein [Prevotella sp.]
MIDPNLILSEDGKTLIGVNDKSCKSVKIPESVTHIGDWAFVGCASLQSIDIPNSVTHICNRAFQKCISLQSLNIPNSVTNIGDWAFSDCWLLQSINIPNSVTNIGDWAFSDCWSLKEIHIDIEDPDRITSWLMAFDESQIKKCTLFIPSSPCWESWEYRHHPVFSIFKNIIIIPRK